jgi:site-specific DNA-methyltransferase (adenine-specific)
MNQPKIELHLGDCFEYMKSMPDKSVDLCLTDPPYGMNNNVDSSRFSGGTEGHIAQRGNGGKFKQAIIGDDKPFDPSPFMIFENVILWGYNHFASRLPVGTTLVWIKRFEPAFGSFLSDAELAWEKGGCGVYCKQDVSLMETTRQRIHPNEKPLSLMKWCIERHPEAATIFDPFMGSGTTGVACKLLRRNFIGCEIDERYFNLAKNRINNTEWGLF